MFKTTLIAAIALAGAQAIKISSQATDVGMLGSVYDTNIGPGGVTSGTIASTVTGDGADGITALAQTGFDPRAAEYTVV